MKLLSDLFNYLSKKENKQATAYEPFVGRNNEQKQMAKLGVSNKPEFSVRILYPRNDNGVNIVDLYAYILYDKLCGMKDENIIKDVRFDRGKHIESYYEIKRNDYVKTKMAPIYQDIVSSSCLIVIIYPGRKDSEIEQIKKDPNEKESPESLDEHENFINELYLCKAVADNECFFNNLTEKDSKDFGIIVGKKNRNWFLPICIGKFNNKKNIFGEKNTEISKFLGSIGTVTIATPKDLDCSEYIKNKIDDLTNEKFSDEH
jgi:hypothetical protein